ncbi:MAG: aminotransferase class I/II-fold pyridoxal phosphate-dependent enzyme [Labilithrix sp.]|nr:aminotransferase class I/II-fold pyridoxal phosphate-dependent enzyme [Labilithrix sp.]MCW5812360.1 aminotransferase class I/II-fold pyridoxal phosphate-dependent enzyme [Labilithrix sp.]
MNHPFDDVSEAALRVRQSAKWKVYPDDVLPLWVAEMDYPLADPIKRVLHAAIDADDAGYADPRGLGAAFAPWAKARWGWEVDPADVKVAPDVVTALTELLLVTTEPGDGVVIDPPVYMPFAWTIRRYGRTVVEAPIANGRLDLEAIARAYASGAKVHVLCSPHNPSGTVHTRAELEAIAALARAHDVLVVSDEIHAPLTHAPHEHVPFPLVDPSVSVVLTSASKTFNLAGLKASVIVACHDRARAVVGRLPVELPYHAGHLGIVAARAAFEHGDPWLAETRRILDRNRALLGELLGEHLPRVRYTPPAAGYLAWLDCRALGLGADPAKVFLERARVALSPGPPFGTNGEGFARLNFATTRAILEEAVRRMAGATS